MLSSFRQSRTASFLSLVATLTFLSERLLQAQYCRGSEVANEWVAQGGYLAADNTIHYTIGFNSNVPQAVRDAVADAMQRWNDYSGVSGIVLEEAAGSPDLYISGSSNGAVTGNCAAFQTGASAIYYDENDYEPWVSGDPDSAAVVMTHEIGHFLGLGDANVGANTIMAQGYAPCHEYASGQIARAPTYYEANGAGTCIRTYHENNSYWYPPSDVQYQPGPGTCLDYWLVSYWYSCTSGGSCAYWYYTMDYLYTICP